MFGYAPPRSALAVVLFTLAVTPTDTASSPHRIAFPANECVLNLRTDLGAAGDGITDDTDALQAGLDSSSSYRASRRYVLFIPNGTYRVTDMLVVSRFATGSAMGPWVYGEHRDSVIIRLDDDTPTCTTVVKCFENSPGNADYFMRNLRNFTIDVGDNPGTDGIWFFSNNTGILKDVAIVGNGGIGVRSTFGQNGPNLIQDVAIRGFTSGIRSSWAWGQTLSRVTVQDIDSTGVEVTANVMSAEDLSVSGSSLPFLVSYPNDWTWWCGLASVVNANLGGSGDVAMLNKGYLWARGVSCPDVTTAIAGEAGLKGSLPGTSVDEYHSHAATTLFDGQVERSLNLPIKPEPDMPWETDTSKWDCANDHGAQFGDNTDDTEALQDAVDAGAAAGKTVVYIMGVKGGDPNWYNISGEVLIHGTVRWIIGLGYARILGGNPGASNFPDNLGRFVVDDNSADTVKLLSLCVFSGSNTLGYENRSTNKTMIVESCHGHIIGSGTGDIFVTDLAGGMTLTGRGQNVWARQLNPEGEREQGLVYNSGATLWALGVKCEGAGIRVRTVNGGRTEILGMFNYTTAKIEETDTRPIFDVKDASLSVTGFREYAPGYAPYRRKITETRGDVVKYETGPDRAHERWNSALICAYEGEPVALVGEDGRKQAAVCRHPIGDGVSLYSLRGRRMQADRPYGAHGCYVVVNGADISTRKLVIGSRVPRTEESAHGLSRSGNR